MESSTNAFLVPRWGSKNCLFSFYDHKVIGRTFVLQEQKAKSLEAKYSPPRVNIKGEHWSKCENSI
jgi:hypothetical protein